MSDIAVRVENLGKRYKIGKRQAGYRTLRESVMDWVRTPFGFLSGASDDEHIWALREVSFEVRHGDVVGIIGRNGAGKSTLLKILSRITRPTTGYARLNGRVGSLLEVGTGFHPELTGRENIFLNGVILGMKRREIGRKFDEIVSFAEVEKFIDTPVKHYSSGMYLRLAFAVAAHLEPEILVVDEVLAVGDAAFQKKCLGKMQAVSCEGRTVLFVSHQMNAVRTLCSRCIHLSDGKIVGDGDTEKVIANYLRRETLTTRWVASGNEKNISSPYFSPVSMSVVDTNLNLVVGDLRADQEFGILIEGYVAETHPAFTVGFGIFNQTGDVVFYTTHADMREDEWPPINKGHNRLVGWIPKHLLNEGEYRVELAASIHMQRWISEPGVNAPAIQLSINGGLSESPYWMIARGGIIAPILPFRRIS
jgi:lipopolysaccharide transport system ATP-binding protein